MVLADLGRKITTALRSLSSATVINEEVCFLIKSSLSSEATFMSLNFICINNSELL